MFDLLGRHIVYTVTVGGNPHFIITGLYPPSIASTSAQALPQQGSTRGMIMTIVVYMQAAVLFVFFFFLLLRMRRR